ncbi:TlpA family protein disulfide reductase [Geomicrobium sediminis]|uniref:Thiol-disulfide isomerase/thioredoxin n=1 Tax=Geomicrobium sediminis TaxID=1347788 RepID=A0ABS2PEC6_9BACL|nr:TlpA disulfide reductase family protein [Geomicrobium sediminis]MBM7633481.1 thiol-disulfide isomerase/thioredoxin [Geomicrobium sediminis]
MKLAPSFSLYNPVTNTYHSLEDYAGSPLLLTFWASWCPDSQIDLDKKTRLYEQLTTTGLHMLFVNVVGREREEGAGEKLMNTLGNPVPYVLDNQLDTYRAYRCEGVPSTFIIDGESKIVETFGDTEDFTVIMKHLVPYIR